MRLSICAVGLSMTLSITGCAGKRVATTFADMGRRVPTGTTVYVTTTDGLEVQGKALHSVGVVDEGAAG